MTEPASNYDGTHPERTIAAAAAILAPVFTQNGWTWAGAANGVPTAEEIAQTITTLVDRLMDGDGITLTSTGRIVALAEPFIREGSEPEKIHLYLDLGTIYTRPVE